MAKATTEKKNAPVNKLKRAPVRLWVKAKFLGYRRSKVNQYENQHLLKIEGVEDHKAAQYYFGKRVCYIYKAHNTVRDTKFRTIWGKVSKAHGRNGVVVARFNNNLPPHAISSTLRVMLYPQRN